MESSSWTAQARRIEAIADSKSMLSGNYPSMNISNNGSREKRVHQAHDQDIRNRLRAGDITIEEIIDPLIGTKSFVNLEEKIEFDLNNGSVPDFIRILRECGGQKSSTAILVNMNNIDIGVEIASEIAATVSQISLEKDTYGYPIFINPRRATKVLLHVFFEEAEGTAVVIEALRQSEVMCWYIGKVKGLWKPILERLHQLGKASSPQLATELKLSDKDAAARLSVLASRKLVTRKWDKSAPGRGAYIYSPIVTPDTERQQIRFDYFTPAKEQGSGRASHVASRYG